MVIPTEKISPMPDAVGLLREYKPGGKPLVIAARIRPGEERLSRQPAQGGEIRRQDDSCRSESSDASKADAEKEKAEHRAEGNINVLIIADTDLLSDQFWVDVREFLGQQIAVPHAHNSALVVNALENLSGSDALTPLRDAAWLINPSSWWPKFAAMPSAVIAKRSRR